LKREDHVSILPIRTLGDPVLREPAREVQAFDDLHRKLIDDMVETMYSAPGVGLAAPQVGLALRLFVFDAGDGAGPGAISNPVLTNLEGEQEEEEGCLSVPGLWYPTRRSMRARVEGLDRWGEPISAMGEGLLARIFQHETDHVNGLLFIDRLAPEDRRRAMGMLSDRELGAGPGRSPRSADR
jgi:peptide deformylase